MTGERGVEIKQKIESWRSSRKKGKSEDEDGNNFGGSMENLTMDERMTPDEVNSGYHFSIFRHVI